MRRTGAVLATIAVLAVGLPTAASATGTEVTATGCVATVLPTPPGADNGASASAILEPGTYLGRTGGDAGDGVIWRDGVHAELPIRAGSVNASGLVVGWGTGSDGRAARLRLGGTPEYAGYYVYWNEINTAGVAAGGIFYGGLGSVEKAMWWQPDADEPVYLPGPSRSGVTGIDDLGYLVGYGEEFGGEQRRELVWDANGQLVRQFGPYADNETSLRLADVDNGIALANRYHPNGPNDVALVDVRTGAVTPLPNTTDLRAEQLEDGWIIGELDFEPVLWHNGAQVALPSPPGTELGRIEDVKVFGSTTLLAGYTTRTDPSSPWARTPTIWQCG